MPSGVLQLYDAANWESTRELLRNEDEIRLVARKAEEYKRAFYAKPWVARWFRGIRSSEIEQATRKQRWDKVKKRLSDGLNIVGIAGDTNFSALGYFR